MPRFRNASVAVGLAVLATTAAQAQVRLKSGVVDLPALDGAQGRARAIEDLLARAGAGDPHVLVQFSGPLSLADRAGLDAAGLTLHTYVGDFAYLAKLSGERADAGAIGTVAALRGAGAFEPAHKLHPMLTAEEEFPSYAVVGDAKSADPTVAVHVLFHPGSPMGLEAAELVQKHGGAVQSELMSLPALIAHLPLSSVAALAAEPSVQWIEPPLPRMTELAMRNDSNRSRTQADLVQAAPYSLNGAGVVAFVFDAGTVMSNHEAFSPSRVTVIDNDGVSGHATHVAGTIGGNGASATGQLRKGMAPAVSIISAGFQWTAGGMFLYSDPGDIEVDYAEAINDHSADIANNSIGSNTENNGFPCVNQGDYGITDAVIDNVVRGSVSGGSPFRIVWANGNERPGFRCNVEGFGEYRSIAPPAGAKNHMTVGALNSNDDSMTSFSSWGPTDDGRMKPDISAPGCQSNSDQGVTSSTTGGTTSYGSLCGTSMASPTVCGLGALVLQDYRTLFPGAPDPRNSTLRALFAHTAEDLFNPGPDYKCGYGSVRVRDAIDLLRTGRLEEPTIGQGAIYTSVVTAFPGQPLKVTIAWDDPAATPLAGTALVNDLDLRLIDPNGVPHLAWTLNPASPQSDAVQTEPNRRDNIEQVYVADPIPGNWTVEVTGFNVPVGPQTFSVIGAGQTTALLASFPSPLPEFLAAGQATSLDIRLQAINQEIEAGSAQFHYRVTDGPFFSIPLTPMAGDIYRATIPALTCDHRLEYYFSATGSVSGPLTVPAGAPEQFFVTGVGTVNVRFNDDFESSQGWTIQNLQSGPNAFAGGWERAVPVTALGAPTEDVDETGSGFCFVTSNAQPNVDVDNGTTVLTSPAFDVSDGLGLLTYHRWYFNNNPNNAPETLRVEISPDNGFSWFPFETVGPTGPDVSGGWRRVAAPIPSQYSTAAVRFRFIATDFGSNSQIEAGVDAFQVRVVTCTGGGCSTDWNDDLFVNSGDVSAFLTAWIESLTNGNLTADFNADLAVNSADISAFLSAWLDELTNGC